MYPHLHVLLPSSSPGIALEARLYLSDVISSPAAAVEIEYCPVPFSASARSRPVDVGHPSNEQSTKLNAWLKSRAVQRLIVACHPWGKLGGSCLDPVISQHLVTSISGQHIDDSGLEAGASLTRISLARGMPNLQTALLTWNVRGVGVSQGSLGLLGLSNRTNERDLEALEDWAFEQFSVLKDYRRMGYSWGSWTVVTPPRSSAIGLLSSVLLVSPPLSIFTLLALPFVPIPNQSFSKSLEALMTSSNSGPDSRRHANTWLAYGANDEFTSRETYAKWGEDHRAMLSTGALVMRELEDAGHFYRHTHEGQWLLRVFVDWLAGDEAA
ncbi:hypothetical protein BD324DRAFT_615231 [Kockovaella imperatae]|uniref:Alpha/Beta hydrolase protein n=1 Tax=Kockovaella imperatae TaxID=4999 RepID=A0A1Y1UP77_9TREE|nr:hypothetical protein BD324DRAFT_615231 [Kockovaella imperatae]ORX39850.1 hypothetical protein BD324DRAFT_615231 [Kockovaella imperatae]